MEVGEYGAGVRRDFWYWSRECCCCCAKVGRVEDRLETFVPMKEETEREREEREGEERE